MFSGFKQLKSSPMKTPDFDTLADLMIQEGAVSFSPSELHGSLAGQLSASVRFERSALETFCATQLDLDRFSAKSSGDCVQALYDHLLKQLESSDFELSLLLPDDDQSLLARAEHLGLWVSGYLAGFGMAISDQAKHLSSDAQDGLKDLVQIAQIEADGEAEEDENLLVEVEEYVRMAAMLLFNECNTSTTIDSQSTVVH